MKNCIKEKIIENNTYSPQNQASILQKDINFYDSKGKIFLKRKSLLTTYLKNTNVNSLANACVSTFIFCCLTFYVQYILDQKNLPIQIYFKNWILSEHLNIIFSWLKIFGYVLLIYPITKQYYFSTGNSKLIWLNVYIIYQFNFLFQVYKLCQHTQLSCVSKIILTVEGIRNTMKMYSFFRENDRLNFVEDRNFPPFKHFLYFLFCPTTLYRDQYPMKKRVSISRVFGYLLKCIATTIVSYIILENYFIPRFERISSKNFDAKLLISEVIINIIPANFFFLLGIFYFYLHCFLNLWAEMLRFGDRMFYGDWWNAISYGEFYKNWNIAVGDWLRTYLFIDIRNKLPPKIRNHMSAVIVILFSSLIHEYVSFMAIGSFCPIFTFTFGVCGVILKFINPQIEDPIIRRTWNLYFWITFMIGNSMHVTLYALEAHLPYSCYNPSKAFVSYFRPRISIPSCYGARS